MFGMSGFFRKIDSLKKLTIEKRPTKPFVAGKELLILSTAPSVRAFFEYESVQKQFEGYDIACINFMLAHSEDIIHRFKPKYFVFIDSVYFLESVRESIPNWMKIDCDRTFEALERIDWDCYIITMPIGEWKINNPHIKFIYLSILSCNYTAPVLGLYRRNIVNPGTNNVIIGAIYSAITFGYKEIAILGAPYRQIDYEMKSDGLHIYEHYHYYDTATLNRFIPNEELAVMKEDYSIWLNKRALVNAKALRSVIRYAKANAAEITNYSEGSQMTMIKQGDLDVEAGVDLVFLDDSLYRYK